jgi:hypothetical protein
MKNDKRVDNGLLISVTLFIIANELVYRQYGERPFTVFLALIVIITFAPTILEMITLSRKDK